MRVIRNLIAVISALAALLALSVFVLVLLGYRPFVLLSPSMEPLYREGSLCLINTKTTLDEVEVGDVLVYRTADFLVLHRLVGISDRTEDGLVVEMQGDANNVAQSVKLSNVNYVGREAFTIPGLGSFVTRLLSMPALIWSFVGVFIVLACVPWATISKKRAVV